MRRFWQEFGGPVLRRGGHVVWFRDDLILRLEACSEWEPALARLRDESPAD
jgi:hypothetical protein